MTKKKKSCTNAHSMPRGGCGSVRQPITNAEVTLIIVVLACVAGLLGWGYTPVAAVSIVVIAIAAARTQPCSLRKTLARLLSVEAQAIGPVA